jgi:glutathione S-transferase
LAGCRRGSAVSSRYSQITADSKEFGSALLNLIGAFYNAVDEATLVSRAAEIRARLAQIEVALGEGPYFAGESFSIVDAVFGPVFRYFDALDAIHDFGFWGGLPNVQRWRRVLAMRPSVAGAVRSDYPNLFGRFLLARRSALFGRMTPVGASA